MTERRKNQRQPMDLFFNKYLDGFPFLGRAVDLSLDGLLSVAYTEPEIDPASFPLELRLPGQTQSLWVWGRVARRSGRQHAIQFLRMSPRDRRRLKAHLESAPDTAADLGPRPVV